MSTAVTRQGEKISTANLRPYSEPFSHTSRIEHSWTQWPHFFTYTVGADKVFMLFDLIFGVQEAGPGEGWGHLNWETRQNGVSHSAARFEHHPVRNTVPGSSNLIQSSLAHAIT